jgi:hypothetical protein
VGAIRRHSRRRGEKKGTPTMRLVLKRLVKEQGPDHDDARRGAFGSCERGAGSSFLGSPGPEGNSPGKEVTDRPLSATENYEKGDEKADALKGIGLAQSEGGFGPRGIDPLQMGNGRR